MIKTKITKMNARIIMASKSLNRKYLNSHKKTFKTDYNKITKK